MTNVTASAQPVKGHRIRFVKTATPKGSGKFKAFIRKVVRAWFQPTVHQENVAEFGDLETFIEVCMGQDWGTHAPNANSYSVTLCPGDYFQPDVALIWEWVRRTPARIATFVGNHLGLGLAGPGLVATAVAAEVVVNHAPDGHPVYVWKGALLNGYKPILHLYPSRQ